ncbi:MAG: helix-turn-helix domain-containing protein [Gammaproteobacteria bacterium]|nr:helix-turn-helix domain-containing protein [Gammaproteobacteria bacterium]
MTDFEVLVVEGTNPTGVAMTRDILDAARLFAERAGYAGPSATFHSPGGGQVRLQGGLSVATRRLPDRQSQRAPVLLVPGIWVENANQLRERLQRDDCQQAIRYIARRAAAGACIAASCSGVFLLQAAGVLGGRRATTTWWLAPELSRIAPDTRVEGNRILCVDGPVITAGAAFAQSDVMLYLLRQRFGAALVDAVSRILLLHERTESAQFVVPSMLASGDVLVNKLTKRVESALPAVPSVAELAIELCISERTLGRHVRHATGMGTNALIQSIRLHRARALLQTSRMSVDLVAEAVGYSDTTALRRLMQKTVGTTPGRVRAAAGVAGQSPRRAKASRNTAEVA